MATQHSAAAVAMLVVTSLVWRSDVTSGQNLRPIHDVGLSSGKPNDVIHQAEYPEEAHCSQFVQIVNSLTVDGDMTIMLHRKRNSRQCRAACLSRFQSRVCMAAIYRHTGVCILGGYRIFPNTNTVHYRRICRSGRGCFQRVPGWESHYHTGMIAVPALQGASQFVKADICRRECEQLVYCRGFDVNKHLQYCPYLEFRPRRNLYFNLFLRTC